MVFGLILLVVVIWVVSWLGANQKLSIPQQRETPADIIKKRYAKGEITKKQFEDMKKELTK